MSNDEIRFNELKVKFGSAGRANQLTLTQFASLTDARAGKLSDLLPDFLESAEVLEIRKRALQASQSSKPMILFAAKEKKLTNFFSVCLLICACFQYLQM